MEPQAGWVRFANWPKSLFRNSVLGHNGLQAAIMSTNMHSAAELADEGLGITERFATHRGAADV